MKVMVMLKGAGADESKIASTREMLAMGDYNERLVKAGIVLDGAGLKPSSEGYSWYSRAVPPRLWTAHSPRRRRSSPATGSGR
jgi:hypothetical protein